MSDRKTGYSPLNAENNRGVTNDAMCAYVHEIYDFNLSIKGFVYLEFVKYLLGLHRNVQIFAKCMNAYQLYGCLYTNMSKLSTYIEINRIFFRCLG